MTTLQNITVQHGGCVVFRMRPIELAYRRIEFWQVLPFPGLCRLNSVQVMSVFLFILCATDDFPLCSK